LKVISFDLPVTNHLGKIRQAKSLQSSLQALAERIDAVKSDHDKLENENKILQDYIGGLTRNMTKSEMTRSTKARKAQK
jgi:hypothetical protein